MKVALRPGVCAGRHNLIPVKIWPSVTLDRVFQRISAPGPSAGPCGMRWQKAQAMNDQRQVKGKENSTFNAITLWVKKYFSWWDGINGPDKQPHRAFFGWVDGCEVSFHEETENKIDPWMGSTWKCLVVWIGKNP